MSNNRSFLRDANLDLETKKVFEKMMDILEPSLVNVTGGLTLAESRQGGEIITLNAAAGQAIVLPPAVGSGARFTFIVGTTITSNSTTIKVANATDVMAGFVVESQDGGATLQMFETAADTDTITMDGSTRGGIVGDRIELTDVAAGKWAVHMFAAGTGTEATPFSATVS